MEPTEPSLKRKRSGALPTKCVFAKEFSCETRGGERVAAYRNVNIIKDTEGKSWIRYSDAKNDRDSRNKLTPLDDVTKCYVFQPPTIPDVEEGQGKYTVIWSLKKSERGGGGKELVYSVQWETTVCDGTVQKNGVCRIEEGGGKRKNATTIETTTRIGEEGRTTSSSEE